MSPVRFAHRSHWGLFQFGLSGLTGIPPGQREERNEYIK